MEYKKSKNKQSSSTPPNTDALARIMINLEDITQLYTWIQMQAKAAFILAISLCVAGFILMSLAIILPIVFRLNLQISIILAISGSIVELIAGTALVVYRYSISQLNHYHKALHEDERFLSCVNLLDQFDSISIRDEMLKEIITSEIKLNLEELKSNK